MFLLLVESEGVLHFRLVKGIGGKGVSSRNSANDKGDAQGSVVFYAKKLVGNREA